MYFTYFYGMGFCLHSPMKLTWKSSQNPLVKNPALLKILKNNIGFSYGKSMPILLFR